jgi:hypothetical protein
MIVNILGTEYNIIEDTSEKNPKLIDANGYIEFYSKEIVLQTHKEPDILNVKNIEKFDNKVLRHEIVHGFLQESGLASYAGNEQIVDWIAIQFPKMLKAMQETKCI